MAKGFWNTGIDPGSLRKRVTFLKPGDALDGLGQLTNGLVEVKTVWADLYPIRGREFYDVHKTIGEATHKCYTRWNSCLKDADSSWYLDCEGKRYAVESIADAGAAGRYFEIYCRIRTSWADMPDYPDDPDDSEPAYSEEHGEDTGGGTDAG